MSRGCHHRWDSASRYDDTIHRVTLALVPSQVADKGRVSRMRQRLSKGQGWRECRGEEGVRNAVFREHLLCAGHPPHIISFIIYVSNQRPHLCSWRCYDSVISMP